MHDTTARLLAWYERQARDLPWRREVSPYRTWLSEIMLQQTRVEAVIPYFERFLARFPTVEALAAAPLDEVLGLWSGLGYYRRARGLHRAAGQVVAQGAFPDTVEGLRRLAGVGEYTAAAIASIAFGRDAIAVDGNLRRVAARLAAIETSPAAGEGSRAVHDFLQGLLPSGRAGDFNQALMDLGATTCLPRRPRCQACPLASDCGALAAGRQEELPVASARKAPRPVAVVALLLEREGALLLVQRPPEGLLAGLWGPPERLETSEESGAACVAALASGLGLPGGPAPHPVGSVEHVFTHQRWRVRVYTLPAPAAWSPPLEVRWWRPGLEGPPLSRLAERLLARHQAVPQQGA